MSEERIWTKGDTDRMLDLYFSGVRLKKLADELDLSVPELEAKIDRFTDNIEGRTDRYKPVQRMARSGKPLSETEKFLVDKWRREKWSMQALARLLARKEIEINPTDIAARMTHDPLRDVATEVDLILCYRYLYYVKGISVIPDSAYDALEKDAIEFSGGLVPLTSGPSSDRVDDYPPHIRALALYVVFKYGRRGDKDD